MRWSRTFQLLDVHCEGEIGRIMTGGQPVIAGSNIYEKFKTLSYDPEMQAFRKMLVLEPRGAAAGSTNLIFPPDDPQNHAGFIVLQPDQAHAMSGSNAICTTTALLETGMIEMNDGENLVRLETAAGLVIAKAHCKDGKCEHVTLTMPASYVEELDYGIEKTQWGDLKADIAFGGVFYAIVDVERIGLTIEPANAHHLSAAGMALKNLLNDQLEISHPENPDIAGIAYVMFRQKEADGSIRTATTMWPGRLDRSPCGTGNAANLATRVARNEVAQGDEYKALSTIGSEFRVRHTGLASIGNKQAVIPEITGRGWTYGMHQIGIDPSDPLKAGWALTDTWGSEAGKI
ncbi:MAG: proline racemase family protein [Pseudomonadota bacterium]